MIIKELLAKQRSLDSTILQKSEPITTTCLFQNRVLAFIVELSEFANEIRTFKHWSTKPQSAQEVCLEEYVDALHFLLSISNNFSVIHEVDKEIQMIVGAYAQGRMDKMTWATTSNHKETMNLLLLALTSMASELYYNVWEDEPRAFSMLIDIWDSFIMLGLEQGFTLDEIEEAYYKKNKVNYKRQESGY